MPVESGKTGAVLRVAYRQIVGMDDQQLGVRGITELLGRILCLSFSMEPALAGITTPGLEAVFEGPSHFAS